MQIHHIDSGVNLGENEKVVPLPPSNASRLRDKRGHFFFVSTFANRVPYVVATVRLRVEQQAVLVNHLTEDVGLRTRRCQIRRRRSVKRSHLMRCDAELS